MLCVKAVKTFSPDPCILTQRRADRRRTKKIGHRQGGHSQVWTTEGTL